jgi:hypothetical protein
MRREFVLPSFSEEPTITKPAAMDTGADDFVQPHERVAPASDDNSLHARLHAYFGGGSASVLPADSQARKDIPLASGLLDYFPAALAEVARVSKAGNDKHNPGQPLHWARGKSADHADTIVRHLIDRGTIDPDDGQRHTAKVAWRALALLQEELEAAGATPGRGSRFPEEE